MIRAASRLGFISVSLIAKGACEGGASGADEGLIRTSSGTGTVEAVGETESGETNDATSGSSTGPPGSGGGEGESALFNLNGQISCGGDVPADRWNHLAGSFDGEFIRVFANGELIDEVAYSGSLSVAGSPMIFGDDPTDEGERTTMQRTLSGAIGHFGNGGVDDHPEWIASENHPLPS